MTKVVKRSTFKLLVQRVEACEREIKFLRSCLLVNQWINRRQASIALGVSEQTMKRYTDKGKFTPRREGKKYMYDIDSIRNYLSAQKIDHTEVDERVLRACATMI